MNTIFFHVDINAFFANVEVLDNPELKGKAVIVGGSISRGVVSTCSYEARKYGVHSGMPLAKAKRLCPKGVFLRTRMKRYHEKSCEVMSILKSYTPDFQQISIDEGFLNMTGTELLLGSAINVAKKLKQEVLIKTKLNVSIGIASTKYFAKLASDFSKPDGLYEIKPSQEIAFIRELPLKKIWGLGKKTIEKINRSGIYDTRSLAHLSLENLQTMLGNASGEFIHNILNAKTAYIFNEPIQSHSISTEQTFESDLTNLETIEDVLFQLASELSLRLISEKLNSNTVFVKIRYSDFKTYTIQETDGIVLNTLEIFERAKKLFYQKYERGKAIRLLGCGVLKVSAENKSLQTELFESKESTLSAKQKLIEETALNIAKKTGKNVLSRARLISKNNKTKNNRMN